MSVFSTHSIPKYETTKNESLFTQTFPQTKTARKRERAGWFVVKLEKTKHLLSPVPQKYPVFPCF